MQLRSGCWSFGQSRRHNTITAATKMTITPTRASSRQVMSLGIGCWLHDELGSVLPLDQHEDMASVQVPRLHSRNEALPFNGHIVLHAQIREVFLDVLGCTQRVAAV